MTTPATRSRSHVRFTQPRANPPFCWICDRMLHGGGRVYVEVIDGAGHSHPAHKSCAGSDKPNPTVQPRSEL